MTPAESLAAGQFGDTTYTKVFVGGLAWETQKEAMKNYFQQFGDILEAVVITDKATGRSKGYGFVTFREAEAALRACVDAAPVIDGRRANCNLASLGVQRSKPSTAKQLAGGGGRNVRVMGSFQTGYGVGSAFASAAAAPAPATTFPHYAVQQGIPTCNLYGYSSYSPDYTYPTNYYGLYGGATTGQYPMYGTTPATAAAPTFYPSTAYLQYGSSEGSTGGTAYGSSVAAAAAMHNYSAVAAAGSVQYPHHHLYQQYSTASLGAYHQPYAPPISLAPSPALHSPGVTMAALPAPIPHR